MLYKWVRVCVKKERECYCSSGVDKAFSGFGPDLFRGLLACPQHRTDHSTFHLQPQAMVFITGTAKRVAQTWIPTSHGSLGSMCSGWSRTATREIRTKAVLRKRAPLATSQDESDKTRFSLSGVAQGTPASGVASIPQLHTPTFIAKKVVSLDKRSGRKSDMDTRSSEAKDTTPRSVKTPKRLEAFPFVPGATANSLAKAHRFFFQPTVFVKSATSLSMIPDNTVIPEVNKGGKRARRANGYILGGIVFSPS